MEEKKDIEYRVHWIAFTVHAPSEEAFTVYELLFKDLFGDLESMGHGGRGYREIYHGLMNFKIYLNPAMGTKQYFSYEIPGSACEVIDWQYLLALGEVLEGNYKDQYHFKRIDFAFDNVPFSPQQVREAIEKEEIRSLAKRKTLEVHESPLAERENGEVGTHTVDFGSRSSERMIRVYDKRGFPRLEFEVKERRADLIGKQIFTRPNLSVWYYIVLAHLLDYIEFKTDWWEDFKDGTERAKATVTTAKDLSMSKMVVWLEKQVSPALSVAIDILPPEIILGMVNRGRERRGPRYNLLLGKYVQE